MVERTNRARTLRKPARVLLHKPFNRRSSPMKKLRTVEQKRRRARQARLARYRKRLAAGNPSRIRKDDADPRVRQLYTMYGYNVDDFIETSGIIPEQEKYRRYDRSLTYDDKEYKRQRYYLDMGREPQPRRDPTQTPEAKLRLKRAWEWIADGSPEPVEDWEVKKGYRKPTFQLKMPDGYKWKMPKITFEPGEIDALRRQHLGKQRERERRESIQANTIERSENQKRIKNTRTVPHAPTQTVIQAEVQDPSNFSPSGSFLGTDEKK